MTQTVQPAGHARPGSTDHAEHSHAGPSHAQESDATSRAGSGRGLAIAATAAVLIALVFVGVAGWALHDPTPHGVPVGVAGPAPAVAAVQDGLDSAVPDGFDAVAITGNPAQSIRDRDVQAALVLSAPEGSGADSPDAGGPPDSGSATVLTASALGGSSTAVSAALEGAARAGGATAVETRDVAPATGDARGAVLQQAVFACAVAGLAFAGLGWFLARRSSLLVRLIVPVLVAAAVGVTVAATADPLLGSLPGNYGGLALALGLLTLAVSTVATGLVRLIGTPALGLMGLLVIVVGNPTSGATLGTSFLPGGLRQLAPLLPNNASVEAIRSALYFDGSALVAPLLVLACWIAAGYLLIFSDHLLHRHAPRHAVTA